VVVLVLRRLGLLEERDRVPIRVAFTEFTIDGTRLVRMEAARRKG
jgi:hypothetical protein